MAPPPPADGSSLTSSIEFRLPTATVAPPVRPQPQTAAATTRANTTRAEVGATLTVTSSAPVRRTPETESDIFAYKPRSAFNRLSLKSNRKRKTAEAEAAKQQAVNDIGVTSSETQLTNSSGQVSAKRSRLDLFPTPTTADVEMNGHMHASHANGAGKESRFSLLDSMSNKNTLTGAGGSVGGGTPPVASLANLGNTCFLNSVLYTLRFTPGFLHSLHHLAQDLGLDAPVATSSSKKKNSGSSNGSTGTNGSIADAETELVHDVVDQLHDLFKNMSCTDESGQDGSSLGSSNSSGSREPIPPNSLLQAVGKLNPMFEGNQQQDAHELLVTVLNTLQDIKIPVPATQVDSNGGDAVDSRTTPEPPVAISQKKTSKKKAAKSIFYSGSSNSQNNSLLVNVSNGLRSSTSKLDQINQANSAAVSPTAKASQLMPNFVKDNFVGKSVMRTRCLECEASTYRSETFTNIDIPLTFDDPCDRQVDETDSNGGGSSNASQSQGQSMFFKQIMASETLRENNKYWCSECSRLNEAQRSVSYEVLPRVMVLQLKRFTASGNKSYTSKINDYIPTPFTMNCFCTGCMPSTAGRPPSPAATSTQQPQAGGKHHYRLYAVIMHLGATLASGHYTAYVRASNEAAAEYLGCTRAAAAAAAVATDSVKKSKGDKGDRAQSNGAVQSNGKGIMKYFSRNSEQRSSYPSPGGGQEVGGCKSAGCCGVRSASQFTPASSTSSSSASEPASSSAAAAAAVAAAASASAGSSTNGHHPHPQRSIDSLDSGTSSQEYDSTGGGSGDEVWLECDDETIHVITRRQFQEDLNTNRGFTTPYLLFYQRV